MSVEEAILKDQPAKTYSNEDLVFRYLPGYAAFIRDNCLIPYIKEQVSICRTIDLPMMKFLEGISDVELVMMGIESHKLFLTCAENNTLKEHLEEALQKWVSDQLVIMKKEDLTAQDISYAGFVRKKSLLKFLPSYTNDLAEAIDIINEIDVLHVYNDIAATNVYIRLLKDRISEQALFTEILSNTTPGLNYIFDLRDQSVKYANRNAADFFGNSQEELDQMGSALITNKIHPDDLQATVASLRRCAVADDGAVVSWEFRLKQKDGKYVWMHNYSSVYKRDDSGKPIEIVGIIMDVHREKEISDRLVTSEKQLLEAQALTNLGSFELDTETGQMTVTPEFNKIYELNDFDLPMLIDHVHPDDRERINKNRDRAIKEGGVYDNEYRYLINGKEKILWSRGSVTIRNGKKVMIGTAMDVTNRHKMLRELLESRTLYQQAQQLSHIGNWNCNLATNEYSWSDEIYRIYEFEPPFGQIDPTVTRVYRHPDDVAMVDECERRLREDKIPSDYTFRINLPSGKLKYLQVKGGISFDEQNNAIGLYGTVQDVTEKQVMLERLQENDRLFKQAQARTHIGNWTWEIAADKVTWSDEMYRVYGLEPQSEEVTYETYLSHIHPDDVEDRKLQVQKVFDTGVPEDQHYRIITPSGSVRILHTKSELQYDNAGRPSKMTGTCQDVTEKQMLIDQLQRSDALYIQAQALSHIGNWTWDLETKKLDWSDELYRIYELEPNSAIDTSSTIGLYNHPQDREMISNSIKHAIETFEPFEFNFRIVFPDGRIKTLNARGGVETDKDAKPVKVYGTVQDISLQSAVEKQLKDSQEFIQKVTDVTPSIIAAYNVHSGQFSFINGAIEKQLGYPRSTVIEGGVPFFVSITHPDDLPAMMEKNTKALEDANLLPAGADEPIAEFKYRMKDNNGAYKWFHTFGTIFERNEKGLVESVLNISIDITEQEEAEQAVYQKNLQLQHSNTSLEEYAYVASHDLKEPLRKIVTFSDRMLTSQSESLTEEGKVFLSKIMESSRRMQKMVNDLLYVSTISGNKEYQLCDLNMILSEALQPLDHKIEELNAIVDFDDLPMIPVVPAQFRQLFLNLVGNSLKFQRKGVLPEIKITHSFLPAKAVTQMELAKAKKYLKIELRDNGIGFDNQYAEKIFAIFQRLHGRSEYEGTGIGLAVCKRIVENHGGIIFAEGKLNEGATFTVIIPV